jgi:hypothetical protein
MTRRVTTAGIPVGARPGKARLIPTQDAASAAPNANRPIVAVWDGSALNPVDRVLMISTPLWLVNINYIVTIINDVGMSTRSPMI